MTILIPIAVLAGLVTVLSPCVLPILPVVALGGLGASRSRALAMVAGLVCSFTVFTVSATSLLSALGLPGDTLRNIGIVVVAAAGVTLLVPAVAALVARPLSAVTRRPAGALMTRRHGIGSGFVLGAGLGLVWTPCAGPILAAIVTVGATRTAGLDAYVLSFAYALGAALPLLVVALAGHRFTAATRIARDHALLVRRVAGAAMIAVAAVFTTSIPQQLAADVPNYTNALQAGERSVVVHRHIEALTGARSVIRPQPAAVTSTSSLPLLGQAPDFTGITTWLNTPGGRALGLSGLRGRVVLVDFWTYSCVNCIRTLPYLTAWDQRYRSRGLVIVGVHTPEFSFEHDVGNIRTAIAEHGIRYPVAVDNTYATWNAWGNQYWPADYLIDQQGRIRDSHFGEGAYAATERNIQALLGVTAATAQPAGVVVPSADTQTPETYLGLERGVWRQLLQEGVALTYQAPPGLAANQQFIDGVWTASRQSITAGAGAVLLLRYHARRVYLVLSPGRGRTSLVRVSLDGRPAGVIRVTHDDLYPVATVPGPASTHLLRLTFTPGTSAYAFTFG